MVILTVRFSVPWSCNCRTPKKGPELSEPNLYSTSFYLWGQANTLAELSHSYVKKKKKITEIIISLLRISLGINDITHTHIRPLSGFIFLWLFNGD